MSHMEDDASKEESLPSSPSKEKQQQIIQSVIREEPAPWAALSTIEERLPYECSRPTVKKRLKELELQNKIKERPFNSDTTEPTKLYHPVHEKTEWMAPPDAGLVSEREQQVLDELRNDDGTLPEGASANATVFSSDESEILDGLRNEDGELPDSRYVRRPYEHLLLDTRIGDCFYQGHNVFGDLTLAGLSMTAILYIAFQIAGALPVSQGTIAMVLFASIVATLLGCFGILGSVGYNLVREASL